MIWILYNVVSLSALGAAATLAYQGSSAWGWFLLVAVLTTVFPGKSK